MTMRLTPNKIVAFSLIGMGVIAIQNRMQSRVIMRQVAEMKTLKEEEQLRFRNAHPTTSSPESTRP